MSPWSLWQITLLKMLFQSFFSQTRHLIFLLCNSVKLTEWHWKRNCVFCLSLLVLHASVSHQLQQWAVLHQASWWLHDELPQPSGRCQVQVLRCQRWREDYRHQDQVEIDLFLTLDSWPVYHLFVAEIVCFTLLSPGLIVHLFSHWCLWKHNTRNMSAYIVISGNGLKREPQHILPDCACLTSHQSLSLLINAVRK